MITFKQSVGQSSFFFHGASERGLSLSRFLSQGLVKKLNQSKVSLPFIVVSLQCPKQYCWSQKLNELGHFVDSISGAWKVDSQRIYLTGLSMGGFACFSLAGKYLNKFAAIAPICGGVRTKDQIERLKGIPMWVFHNSGDPIVSVKYSLSAVDTLRKMGATNVKMTIYEREGHDCWSETYDNVELYEWFLKHTRQ